MQMIAQSCQLDVRPAQIHFARYNLQPFKRRGSDFLQEIALAQQGTIGARARNLLQTDTACRVRLRIEIKKKYSPASHRRARGQVHRRGGFAHPALLVGDGDHFGWHTKD
jgi:hypothetical protein